RTSLVRPPLDRCRTPASACNSRSGQPTPASPPEHMLHRPPVHHPTIPGGNHGHQLPAGRLPSWPRRHLRRRAAAPLRPGPDGDRDPGHLHPGPDPEAPGRDPAPDREPRALLRVDRRGCAPRPVRRDPRTPRRKAHLPAREPLPPGPRGLQPGRREQDRALRDRRVPRADEPGQGARTGGRAPAPGAEPPAGRGDEPLDRGVSAEGPERDAGRPWRPERPRNVSRCHAQTAAPPCRRQLTPRDTKARAALPLGPSHLRTWEAGPPPTTEPTPCAPESPIEDVTGLQSP